MFSIKIKGVKTLKKIVALLITFGLIFLLPTLGSMVRNGADGILCKFEKINKHLPCGYGIFPAQSVAAPPGFNLTYFIGASVVAAFIVMFLVFPKLFGFKKPLLQTVVSEKAKFPYWFWAALPVLIFCWIIMWTRAKLPLDLEPLTSLPISFSLEKYTFVPLWWAFICILDGFVYKRNYGISLISSKPKVMQLLAVVSCYSWFAFEYLNYFVMENWYYPNGEVLSNFGNIAWFSMSYTTVLPAIVEWYLLLKTFPRMRGRYSQGPRLKMGKIWMIGLYIVGIVLAFLMGYYPYQLFWVLWVALVPLLSAVMGLNGLWTPFKPIREGNWSPLLLIAIATLINGFFWEMWNFGSEWFKDGIPLNPNYWQYSVPYLDKFKIFSEMPILGYFGYLFFGVNCWILWLTAAYIFKFDPNFELKGRQDETRGR